MLTDINQDLSGYDVHDGIDAASAAALALAPDMQHVHGPKRMSKKDVLLLKRQPFADALYETNHLTADRLADHFSEFDFCNIVMDTNADNYKKNYGLTKNQILKIWKTHSKNGNVANCMHCGIRKIGIPNFISGMTSDRRHTDEDNHPLNACKYLPNAFFVFRSTEQKQAIDAAMNKIRANQGTIDDARAVWSEIKTEYNTNAHDVIGIVCYHCYNFNLEKGEICMDCAPQEDHTDITDEAYIRHTYDYLVPFLIAKSKCIYNEKGWFCRGTVISKNSLTHCRPENVERVTELIEIKDKIIRDRMKDYNQYMDLFICKKHLCHFCDE